LNCNFGPMTKENYNVVGVMSGTSLDGIDLAHINFETAAGKWTFEILESETIAYPDDWVATLKEAVSYSKPELDIVDAKYTKLLAKVIRNFVVKHQIENLDAVCSHGHTVLHQPQNGITLQIGNLREIASLIGQTVVCDFRVADVALGGQGAPLVPIGDRILFSDYDYCLNLGGFSNVSFEHEAKRIAFDISPVNTVLNSYANILGLEYDNRGEISQSGQIDKELLEQLDSLEFYSRSFPKSLGYEFVKEIVLPIIESYNIPIPDKLRTFAEHIARQISLALPNKNGKMLITGGGAYNDFLISLIKNHLQTVEIVIPDKKLLEFKEALIFALLGVLRLRNEVNVLSSVTGARHDHSSGKIFNNN
jgi:anhydro-N-acetylmuramic acid kinase